MGMFGIGDKQPLSFNPQTSQPIDAGANQLIPMAGPQQVSAPFFGKGGTGRNVLLGGLGGALDGVARWGGAQPGYANAMQQQQEQAQALADRMAEEKRWREQLAAKSDAERSIPQLANLGNGGLATWSANDGMNVIREPQADTPDWDPYARQFGEPGTPQYTRAAQDYVLRSGGPTASGYKQDIKQTIPGKAAPAPRASSGGRSGRSGSPIKLPSGFILD